MSEAGPLSPTRTLTLNSASGQTSPLSPLLTLTPAHSPWSLPQFLDEPLPTVHHWTSQQVGQWLHSLNLEQYAAEFAARQVDGPQLLQLDGSRLKVGQVEGLPPGGWRPQSRIRSLSS